LAFAMPVRVTPETVIAVLALPVRAPVVVRVPAASSAKGAAA
jgi:hypothetical protein